MQVNKMSPKVQLTAKKSVLQMRETLKKAVKGNHKQSKEGGSPKKIPHSHSDFKKMYPLKWEKKSGRELTY